MVRAAFIAACAAGEALNILGAFIALRVVNDLGARYAVAPPALQTALIETYLTVSQFLQACFNAGSTFYALGLLLVAWVAWPLQGVPRWLTVWMALLGLFTILDRAQSVVTGVPLPFFPVGLLVNVLGSMGLFLAIALVFWRRAPAPLEAHANQAPPPLATVSAG
jgi:hypothetical protein